ncbi:MAG: molybdenum cofactor synthesis domain-containing protein [Candidatus Jordarchaeum sp.]|uniref:molybdenum cofactor synthesis domain-containing protein n=1 Tax=Candidatus Jordarchaeum sp. TaxID=2823881 RepID=UPI00404A503C
MVKETLKSFYTTTPLEEVLRELSKISIERRTEKISINEAFGRVLAEDFFSPINVPHFKRASRDGYAVKASDTFGAEEDEPKTFELLGEIRAGEKSGPKTVVGGCVKIATGAPLPEGADAVVMVEYTEEEENQVRVYRPVSPEENVIKIGRDIKENQKLLSKGTVLNIQDLGVLSATGVTEVKVYSKPLVMVASTGDEIISPGTEMEPGKIYDINSITITQAVKQSGGEPVFRGVIPDNKNELIKAIRYALENTDIAVFSGGTSKGPGDNVPTALREVSKADFLIHGVSIKPGKPTAIAVYNGKPVFMLPGYPTSALMVYYNIVEPQIRRWAGLPPTSRPQSKAITGQRIYSERGRFNFQPVRLEHEKEGLIAYPVPTGSEAITTLAYSQGYIEIKPEVQFIPEREEVTVYLFHSPI